MHEASVYPITMDRCLTISDAEVAENDPMTEIFTFSFTFFEVFHLLWKSDKCMVFASEEPLIVFQWYMSLYSHSAFAAHIFPHSIRHSVLSL